MNSEQLLKKLKEWRRNISNLEGIESFKIFHNKVLENISQVRPQNREELMTVKGLGEKKFAKYGKEILGIINDGDLDAKTVIELPSSQIDRPLSVSAYLDLLNSQIRSCSAKIQGEISSVDIRERVVYFSIKDSEDESVINCLIWRNDYHLSGIDFEIGMEILAEGIPDIYKPSGRLAFKVSSIELVGEGALKKAYDKLKNRLEVEGLFLEERKKPIPTLPQKIGLITSETGAVINDFLTNLGKYGFQIKFVDSRVEGQAAVRDLISAVDYFYDKDIDVLVIIRGGGSLESLQAFNNEMLVRKIANFSKPIICGIGHEKDAPLASLVADKMVSTPTSAAHILNRSWQEAVHGIELGKEKILGFFGRVLAHRRESINSSFNIMENFFGAIFENFNRTEESFKRSFVSLRSRILEIGRELLKYPDIIIAGLLRTIGQTKQRVLSIEKLMLTYSPERQLKMGYSIVRFGGAIVKKVEQLKIGESVDVTVGDGIFESKVKNIHK